MLLASDVKLQNIWNLYKQAKNNWIVYRLAKWQQIPTLSDFSILHKFKGILYVHIEQCVSKSMELNFKADFPLPSVICLSMLTDVMIDFHHIYFVYSSQEISFLYNPRTVTIINLPENGSTVSRPHLNKARNTIFDYISYVIIQYSDKEQEIKFSINLLLPFLAP